jgi:hypothetical protein
VLHFLKYVPHLKLIHEDVLIKFFMSSLQPKQRVLLNYSFCPRSITLFTCLFNIFFKKCAIKTEKDESLISCLTKGFETSKSRFLLGERAHEEGEDSKEVQDLGDDDICPFDL